MQEEKLYKHPQWGHVYGRRLRTPLGRVAWPELIKPKENTFPVKEGERKPDPKFEVTFLFSKSSPNGKAFIEKLKAEAKEMVALYNNGNKVKIAIDEENVLKDGDAMDELKYPYYKDS